MSTHAVTVFPPDLILDRAASAPLFSQLYQRLRRAILAGQIASGARLPSTRTLARQLHVSRNIVVMVYELLVAEGLLVGHVGHGTLVAPLTRAAGQIRPHPAPHQARALAPRSATFGSDSTGAGVETAAGGDGRPAVCSAWSTQRAALGPADGAADPRAFDLGVSALDAFPHKLWARLLARRLRGGCEARHALFTTPFLAGYQPLREAIAAHLGVTRGVRCAPDQVIVVASGQCALHLAVRALLAPGDVAWVEDPGGPGARAILGAAGAQIVPVAVDSEGFDVAAGVARHLEARVAIVTPSHQLPLGVTMSPRRRLALLAWAQRTGGWIIEDDYDSDFRYAGRPLAALQGLDEAQRVLYVGTVSKVLSSAVRVGYLVAPPQLMEVVSALCHYEACQIPVLEQAALADFMSEGHFTRHITRLRSLYAQRRAALLSALRHEVGDRLTITVPAVGLSLVGYLPFGVDDATVARQAAAHDVDVLAVSRYRLEPSARGGLVLGYAAASEAAIMPGVQRLAAALSR
jgi:GntR family transcriptional regulator/MocR family aminotransferase